MSISSNALPDELDSAYYLANESLCKKWEEYVLKKGGKITGSYNAWSLTIKSLVTGKKQWLIDVHKATLSNGYLFFSSKKQNLAESLIFTSIFRNTGCGNFRISRSLFLRKKQDHPFYDQVATLLEEAIRDKSLYKARFKNSRLEIEFQHKNDWFEMADQILEFEYIDPSKDVPQ